MTTSPPAPSLRSGTSAAEALARLDEAVAFLKARFGHAPPVGVVCGSGYRFLESHLGAHTQAVDFHTIPHLGACTNEAHAGRLIIGRLGGAPVAVLLGRLHLYEGYSPEEVVFPVRMLARWGVESFLLTNAAGSLSPKLGVGDLMAISDHLNLLGVNPLAGPNLDALGTRFPDMTAPYDKDLIHAAHIAALNAGFDVETGVYVATPGPSYETPAEIRMFKAIGADAVGMSTVPETIALRHMGRRVFGLSTITNAAAGLGHGPLSDDDVRAVMTRDEVQSQITLVLTAVASHAAVHSHHQHPETP